MSEAPVSDYSYSLFPYLLVTVQPASFISTESSWQSVMAAPPPPPPPPPNPGCAALGD